VSIDEVEVLDTKEKTVKVASELFSKYGYSGTSVRDIATACGINVAAINYHFGSKHNLYWIIVNEAHQRTQKGIQDLGLENHNIEDLTVKIYDYLVEEIDMVRTTLKVMMTDGVPDPDGEAKEKFSLGPPGQEIIEESIRKALGFQLSADTLDFAVKCIFGQIIHYLMICSCTKLEMLKAANKNLTDEGIRRYLRIHSRAVCDFIKNNPNIEML
tara:strand:- start:180 stop:821 length:642 start_codon:yes stop_codon:yes gene_type:complete